MSPLPTFVELSPSHAPEDPPIAPAPSHIRRLIVYLIKPSRYDDDGYVVRHLLGVLPSNTLACLDGLTADVQARRLLGAHVKITTHLVDEAVQKVPLRRIIRTSRRKGTKVVVGLVGVQSNQFPRAVDIARELRKAGVTVMIGGFHVSGMIAMFSENAPGIGELTGMGVTVVAGEVEDQWARLLSDAVNDRLRPLYNFLTSLPDLRFQPLPRVSRRYLRRFAISNMGTIDASRGCPFNCSFCTIINVQGRKMRCRDPKLMRRALIENYHKGIAFYFFTDDNFSRNKHWKEIFAELIALREEGYDIGFMMQIDTLAHKIPDFVEMASKAGCTQVFIGMESVDPANLEAAGKKQNDVAEYAHMAQVWHDAGVKTHVGYIIGFPHDTPESVHEAVHRLVHEIKVDLASFFMLVPLPGSRDHKEMVERGEYMDPDFNKYDSFHPTTHHPHMSAEEWYATYQRAWAEFYHIDHMKARLRRMPKSAYWDLFVNLMWYKHSVMVEGTHPMVTGFFRLKGRRMRRPGYAIEPWWAYWKMRVREVAREMRLRFHLLWELQELWLQTRRRTETEARLADILERIALQGKRARLRLADWQAAFAEAQARMPSRLRLLWGRVNPLSLRWTYTRQDLNNFWHHTRQLWARRAFYRINWPRVAWNFVRDMTITARFTISMALRV